MRVGEIMFFIAHRGNIDGKNPEKENSPDYIDKAIQEGYDVEVDVWGVRSEEGSDKMFLGHDSPEYEVDSDWFLRRRSKLWIHAKNLDALTWFSHNILKWNVFWHQEDDFTLTGHRFIWTYPKGPLNGRSIAVMSSNSEYSKEELLRSAGVCSDNVAELREMLDG
tara:strand:- start:1350 stop:1844 length:495 start_codon:yes stop_codon:yes gene_type:complete